MAFACPIVQSGLVRQLVHETTRLQTCAPTTAPRVFVTARDRHHQTVGTIFVLDKHVGISSGNMLTRGTLLTPMAMYEAQVPLCSS